MSTSNALSDFKKLIRKAIFLTKAEEEYFNRIPNEVWQEIFSVNFESNLSYASRVILGKYKEIEKIDAPKVDREKKKIVDLDRATKMLVDAIEKKIPVLLITDFDNDGSLAQAIANEFFKVDVEAKKNIFVEYAQTLNGNKNRGLTLDIVEHLVAHKKIDTDSTFVVMTADNGINSREEQEKIQKRFPKANIIITDHHLPDDSLVVLEDDKTVVFNPAYRATPFFKKYNISGAATLGVLLSNVLARRFGLDELVSSHKILENITSLSKVANLLDYVKSSPVDKPEKDYIITKFLQLQPLLNTSNSMKTWITGFPSEWLDDFCKEYPLFDRSRFDLVIEELKAQNRMAYLLLDMYSVYQEQKKQNAAFNISFEQMLFNTITGQNQLIGANPNWIEQLRPVIFQLSADEDKDDFSKKMNEQMLVVFENLRAAEETLKSELRKFPIVKRVAKKNSSIVFANPNVTRLFNRKFLNKVYNDENLGFSLTLDSVGKDRVSGSFRSLFPISSILKDRNEIESKLGVKIETPGHEMAAGFIMTSTTGDEITIETINRLNDFIEASIEGIRVTEKTEKAPLLLTDLSSIALVDRINQVIRGNVSNFAKIAPVLKISKDTVWTDSYSTEQFTMQKLLESKQYGYISINTNFHGDTVIVPIELIRKIVANQYEGFLSLGYMDGGVFIADKIVSEAGSSIIDMSIQSKKTSVIKEAFDTDFMDGKYSVRLNREQIFDNPFFKYSDSGENDFSLFERLVISILDSQKVDIMAVFDVEANGFGNSKLMNFGSMNYSIVPSSGTMVEKSVFESNSYYGASGEHYLYSGTGELRSLTLKQKEKLPDAIQKTLLSVTTKTGRVKYFYKPDDLSTLSQVRNYKIMDSGKSVLLNREIEAEMLAFLVKDSDFKVPQEMINLTGITQEVLDKYGRPTAEVDSILSSYYQGKKVIYGAHNTPYDARVLRANTPRLYQVLKNSYIYDSALFSKDEKLAYDDIGVATFKEIEGIPSNIFFYENSYSDFTLSKFLETNKNGVYPDRTGKFLLENEEGFFYLINKSTHEKIRLKSSSRELMDAMVVGNIPNISVKYSVESLSTQWMIRSLLLSGENFHIKKVDLSKEEFKDLKKFESELVFFQERFFFGSSPELNWSSFVVESKRILNAGIPTETIKLFLNEFLEINVDIQKKFKDAWMYKKVLEVKDPVRSEITTDLVDLVYSQTHIPQEKIKEIFENAISFKEKFGVNAIMQHESHVNGPWRGDSKGDVAFEDKLTLTLLSKRFHNSFNQGLRDSLNTFNEYQIKAQLAFDLADYFSEDLANDSYSYRQGLQYERNERSSVVDITQEKEKNLHIGKGTWVKFKLSKDLIPQDTSIMAIIKDGVVLTRNELEENAKMLDFIVFNEQLRFSLKNIKEHESKEQVEMILDSNREKIQQYREKLGRYFRYIEFSRRDVQFKKLLEALMKGFEGKIPKTPISHLSVDDLTDVKKILLKYCENVDRVFPSAIDPEMKKNVFAALDSLIAEHPLTDFERALQDNTICFSSKTTKESLTDDLFLKEVSVLRRDPLKNMATKHSSLGILNNFINGKEMSEFSQEMKVTCEASKSKLKL